MLKQTKSTIILESGESTDQDNNIVDVPHLLYRIVGPHSSDISSLVALSYQRSWTIKEGFATVLQFLQNSQIMINPEEQKYKRQLSAVISLFNIFNTTMELLVDVV